MPHIRGGTVLLKFEKLQTTKWPVLLSPPNALGEHLFSQSLPALARREVTWDTHDLWCGRLSLLVCRGLLLPATSALGIAQKLVFAIHAVSP